jgi:hypothetical protein
MNKYLTLEEFEINEALQKELKQFIGADFGETILGQLKTSSENKKYIELVKKGLLQLTGPPKDDSDPKNERNWFALTQVGYNKLQSFKK